jgi:Protein of unknown function (DUF3048).
MKKIFVIALIVVLTFSVLACNASQTPAQQGGVGASTVINGGSNSSGGSGQVSPFTGMPGVSDYRPVQVQIDNESTGRPQNGIQAANVVYEALIEESATRLSAIYNDTLPTKVGPVRSSRVYFQYIQNEWDSIYVHDGGPWVTGFTKSNIYSAENGGDMKVNIDGTRRPSDDQLKKVTDAIAYANVQLIEDKNNYARTQRNPLFKFDAKVDYSKYQGFSKIDIPFTGAAGDNQVEYTYDKNTDLLTRYNFGQPFLNADDKKVVTVQNVIVEYVTDEILPNEGGRRVLGVIGSGKADFFIGGKHMTGTWQKTDRHAGTVYKLDDGSGLVLKPGNTWIELQTVNKTITVS